MKQTVRNNIKIDFADFPQIKRRQTMNSNFKLLVYLDNGAYMPDKAHSTDAGFDLRTPNRVVLRAHSSACIDTAKRLEETED